MARRGSGGGGGSSSAGGGMGTVILVVFLIFFIILSLTLGVTTYLGFAVDDTNVREKKKFEDELKVMETDRDWYKFQASLYRAYMGQTQNLDFENLAVLRANFDSGKLTGKEKDEVKTLVTTVLDKKMTWDQVGKRPKLNYEDLLATEKKKTSDAETVSANFQKTEKAEKDKVANLEEQLKTAKDAHEKEFADFKKRSNDELAKYIADIEKLNAEKDALGQRVVVQVKAGEDDKRRIEKNFREKEEMIAGLRKQLKLKDDVILDMKKELGREVPVAVQMEWKIVRIDPRGETVYINLGSADKVQPQLTFRVHGIGTDNRPLPKDKAQIEVLNVLGDHLSQAKVNYVTTPRDKPRHDPRRDPVLTGDVIINPSWNPHHKKHIAIAGVVDLTGDGRDNTEQFVRALERQNIVVDAYLDLRKDFTMKGPGITVQTDYLIMGDVPSRILGAQDRDKEIQDKITAEMAKMEKMARENGVKVRGLRQYLEEIGFRIPGSTTDKQQPSIDFKGDLGELPPAVPKDPMKMEEKPPVPMPDK